MFVLTSGIVATSMPTPALSVALLSSVLEWASSWLSLIAPAWIAGTLLALLSAPLGCLVMWRRMAFFADALAHGTLFGVALATLWQWPLGAGILLVSLLVVISLVWLEDARLPSDALLAMLAATLLCLGLLTLTQLTQQQANLLSYLFGNLLEVGWHDLPIMAGGVCVGLVLLRLIWRPQVLLATNEALAQVAGVKALQQRLFFMGILAGFCAMALQAVGSLLIGALLILPALSARLWARSPTQMLIIAVVLAQVAVTVGIWGSVWLDIQTGLAIVLTLSLAFFTSFVVRR